MHPDLGWRKLKNERSEEGDRCPAEIIPDIEALLEGAVALFEREDFCNGVGLIYVALDIIRSI